MPEKLQVTRESFSQVDERRAVILTAWLAGNDFPWSGDQVEVALLVNGKEVSFTRMVQKIYATAFADFDVQVALGVQRAIQGSSFVGLVQKIEDMIVQEVRNLTGVDLNSDGDDD